MIYMAVDQRSPLLWTEAKWLQPLLSSSYCHGRLKRRVDCPLLLPRQGLRTDAVTSEWRHNSSRSRKSKDS